MVVPYREDLDAARARIDALEGELAELKRQPSLADVSAREEIVDLKTKNWELQVELARARDESVRPIAGEPPSATARRLEREVAELEAENAALREAARANAVALQKVADSSPVPIPRVEPPARITTMNAVTALGLPGLVVGAIGLGIHSLPLIVVGGILIGLVVIVGQSTRSKS